MKKICLCMLTCVLLTGCRWLPQPREMGDMALIRCVGVDPAGEEVSLTMSTGPQAEGTQGGEKPALCLSAVGKSLSGAAQDAQVQSEKTLFFGYVDQLLLGEEQMEELAPVLHWLSGDRELSLGVRLWVIQGDTAKTAVESGGDSGVDARLANLRMEGTVGMAPISRTAREVAIALEELDCAYAPSLELEEEKLVPQGYAVLTERGLAGYLEGEAARGLELLAQKPMAELLELELPGNRVTVRVSRSKLDCKGVFGGDGLERLELNCQVQVEVVQQDQTMTAQEREQLARQVQGEIERRVQGAVRQLQDWGTDCVALRSRLALAEPWYEPCRTQEWEEIFAGTQITVSGEVTLGIERS